MEVARGMPVGSRGEARVLQDFARRRREANGGQGWCETGNSMHMKTGKNGEENGDLIGAPRPVNGKRRGRCTRKKARGG